jgi:hypothetical protein
MNATTCKVRITERLIAEVLTLAQPGALLDAAKAAEAVKDGWLVPFAADAARELAGHLDAWPGVWDDYARAGELSWGACTALKKSLKAVAAQLAAALPVPQPAEPPAAPADVQEAPLPAPEPATLSPTLAAPDATGEVPDVLAAETSAPPAGQAAAATSASTPPAPAMAPAVKPPPLPTEQLHELARRWLAGERIIPLAKEVGMTWQTLHSTLTGRLGYRKPAKKEAHS